MPKHSEAADVPVVFDELACVHNKKLGVITLNSPQTLNSLTLDMIGLMLDQLDRWQQDNNIVCVFIKGAGEKALCAGGDIQALYRSVTKKPGEPCDYAETFFCREYQLDYRLHRFAKPVIGWGDGIVMGGGLGVFAACSHRIVTEKTRLAMPEVSIGLFPDVGGSWFLNNMPGHVGEFLALTGAPLNGADSLFCAIADYFITAKRRDELLSALCRQPWSGSIEANRDMISGFLKAVAAQDRDQQPVSNVETHLPVINALCAASDVNDIVDAIADLNTEDKWLSRAQKTLLAGSPLSVLIIHRQLAQSRERSLVEVFQSELVLATNIIRYPEFSEGIRALIIDKDNNPHWQFASINDVPAQVVDQFFITPQRPAPWPGNPLDNL